MTHYLTITERDADGFVVEVRTSKFKTLRGATSAGAKALNTSGYQAARRHSTAGLVVAEWFDNAHRIIGEVWV